MIAGVMPVLLDAGWVAVLAAFRPDMGPSVQPRDMPPRGQLCLMPMKEAGPPLLPVVGILGSLLASIATAATGASVIGAALAPVIVLAFHDDPFCHDGRGAGRCGPCPGRPSSLEPVGFDRSLVDLA